MKDRMTDASVEGEIDVVKNEQPRWLVRKSQPRLLLAHTHIVVTGAGIIAQQT